MSNPKIYFNEVNERQATFHRRAFLMAGVAGVGLAALGTRLGYLQLVEADKYKVLSLNNEFQSRLQPPPRGLILDRNGVVLASNRPDFRLYVSRDENTDVEDLLDRLEKLVPLDDAHRSRHKWSQHVRGWALLWTRATHAWRGSVWVVSSL